MSEIHLGGVWEDFTDLISDFSRKQTFDFSCFIDSWKEMQFHQFYSGRSSCHEMRFFVQHSLMIAKELFLRDTATDFEKTGALFLLNALFMDQPILPRAKIRIELDELRKMHSFVIVKKESSHDVVFAFFKLIFKNAFHFVFSYLARTAEKNGVVDVRSLPSGPEYKVKKEEEADINSALEELGFDTGLYKKVETLYNSDLGELQDGNEAERIQDLKSQDFFKEFYSKFSGLNVAPTKRKAFNPKSFEKKVMSTLESGEAGPSRPKDVEPIPEPSSVDLPTID